MSYAPPSVIVGLHRRKVFYQRAMIFGWVAAVLFALTLSLVIANHASPPAHSIDLSLPPDRPSHSTREERAGYQPPPTTIGHPSAGGFGHFGALHYTVVRDYATYPIPPKPDVAALPLESEPECFLVAVTDTPVFVPSGEGLGIGAENAAGNFGLPEQPLWAEALATARFPGSDDRASDRGYSSPAIIEWTSPEYPDDGYPQYALVRVLLTVAPNGAHSARVLSVDLWRPVHSGVTGFMTLPTDPYGFAASVLRALDNCIFWPGKDLNGSRRGGDYLVSYLFRPSSSPTEDVLISCRGSIIVRPRRF